MIGIAALAFNEDNAVNIFRGMLGLPEAKWEELKEADSVLEMEIQITASSR